MTPKTLRTCRAAARAGLGYPDGRTIALGAVLMLAVTAPAFGYIGPGAGFAVLGSFLAVLAAMASALLTLLTWPVRWVVRAIRGRRAFARSRVKRVVVLGLDGLEPTLLEKYMAEGRLPNFARLAEMGTYCRLRTTLPALTPVAWSSFLTGCNPGKHNVFDFLTVDRKGYVPVLSSVHIGGSTRTVRLGPYRVPLGKPEVRLLRKGRPFWNDLGAHGIFSSIIRMPITFPPEKFRGTLLSAMCVPDLRGSQGTFSFYTTRPEAEDIYTGGERIRVQRQGKVIAAHLIGPRNPLRADEEVMRAPFTVTFNGRPDSVELKLCGTKHTLMRGEYTPWIRFHFRAAPGTKVHGICQFLLLSTEPHFELYVTPLQLDPAQPALPISHPCVFSTYLAKAQGPFATLGLAEDTWAHNERILQDPGFLHQCVEGDAEREVMFFDALNKVRRGLVVCVFDGSDRIQHMFWRYLDPRHPAHEGFGEPRLRDAIPEMFERMDRVVGRALAKCDDEDTVLFVISDHGCKSFRYGVDLNRWLIDNGYLHLKEPPAGRKYLATVDWSRTRAYALGLAGIYLNLEGRERQGIVKPGAEAAALRAELCTKLTGLRDPRHDDVAVVKAYNAYDSYVGPYTENAPDVLVGYNEGYRVSWEAAIGDITDTVFHDNRKAWSADHCIDPPLVPGVLLCNRRITTEGPRMTDFAPTILSLFGVDVPRHLDGKVLGIDAAEPAAGGQAKEVAHVGS
ncbi:MAG TPA: alkaline phosphatase family protein [Phycisphaerae bacterium]|nr:alkaline phosphatase family protein [Phycisphaerae bacterium]HNU45715.1 alkaline phosphatase family protein [Phycisphaerae bacterium]